MVKRFTYFFGVCIILLSVSGCNVGNIVKTKKDEILFTKISELELQIEQEKWDDSLSDISKFEQEYADRKWKLQLLAAKTDYQDIEIEVKILKEYIKDQDKVESISSLRQILYRLNVIYNM